MHTYVLICICSAGAKSVLLLRGEKMSLGKQKCSEKKSLGIQKCTTCPNKYRWSKMVSTKIWDEDETEDPDAFHWHYKCVTCVQASEKFDTEAQAWAYILEVSGTATRKKAKVDKFTKARTEMEETFSAMGVTKKGRELYQLTRKSIMGVFEDIAHLIQLKVSSLEILASTLETHKALREELARTTDIVRIKEIVELIAEENGKNHAMLAFKDKDGRRSGTCGRPAPSTTSTSRPRTALCAIGLSAWLAVANGLA
jgi:hypothetical protein